jgi:hypothetical protein
MKLIKKFEEFVYGASTMPSPSTNPTIAPTKPATRPSTRPGKPSPIRRDKPAVEPAPKAEKKLKEATMEEVIQKFANLTNQNY